MEPIIKQHLVGPHHISTGEYLEKARERHVQKSKDDLIASLQKKGLLKKTRFAPPLALKEYPVIQPESAGELLDVITFPLPDSDATRDTNHAKHLDGSEAAFYDSTMKGVTRLGELNMSTVLGQLFDIVYSSDNQGEDPPLFFHGSFADWANGVDIGRTYDHDVLINAMTVVSLPPELQQVCYVEPGNLNMSFCGARVTFNTEISAWRFDPYTYWYSNSVNKEFLNVARLPDQSNDDKYENSFTVWNTLKLPIGTSDFIYWMNMHGTVFTSKDFSDLSSLNQGDFGFALLDFRNRQNPSRFPIMRDPLGAWEKQPFGGMRTQTVFYIHEIKNEMAR